MNPYKTIIARQQKIIEDLKAEITYWEETAIYWRDQYEEAESEIDYWQSYY